MLNDFYFLNKSLQRLLFRSLKGISSFLFSPPLSIGDTLPPHFKFCKNYHLKVQLKQASFNEYFRDEICTAVDRVEYYIYVWQKYVNKCVLPHIDVIFDPLPPKINNQV